MSSCFSVFASSINQLSESEESEDEGEEKAASEKKAAHSSGKKYVPPKIAPMHYGKLVFYAFACKLVLSLFLIPLISYPD